MSLDHKFVEDLDLSVYYMLDSDFDVKCGFIMHLSRWCSSCARAFLRAACQSSSVLGVLVGPGNWYRIESREGKG